MNRNEMEFSDQRKPTGKCYTKCDRGELILRLPRSLRQAQGKSLGDLLGEETKKGRVLMICPVGKSSEEPDRAEVLIRRLLPRVPGVAISWGR